MTLGKKIIMNIGPHTITSTQQFKESTTVNGIVTTHLNKKPLANAPSIITKSVQNK